MLIPILPLYAKDLGATYGLIGLVSAGVGLGTLIGDIPGGMLVRGLGHKRGMLIGTGCAALATTALFWARSVPEVVAYRLLAGFGQALYSVARHAYIADAVRVSGRGRAISLLGGLFRIGRFLGPLAGGTIAQAYGLRLPFLVVGAVTMAAFAAMATFVRTTSGQPRHAVRHPGVEPDSLPAMLRSQLHILAPAGAGQLFAQMIRAGRSIVIPLYAADAIGLDVQAIGLIVSLSSAVDMLLFYPAGLIMDRLGRKWAIVPSFVIQAVGMSLVPLTGSFAGLLLAATLIGFGNGFSSGSMMTLGADLAPTDARGEFLGIWRLIGDVGTSGGPLVVGGIADAIALPITALIMGCAGLLAGAIFAWLVPETLSKPQTKASLSSSHD
jgi:MFS family permease